VRKGSGGKSRKSGNSTESQEDGLAADGVIALTAVADIAVARDVTEALRDALDRQAPVVVDAAAVEDLSTPCAQALAAAAASFADANVALAFRQPSDAFIAAFSRVGLYAAMMRWSFVE
jgi:anti-anti-sigma regulatory factor